MLMGFRMLQGLVLLAPAVDITELWWQALSAAEQADARATGFVPLGGGTKVGMLHWISSTTHGHMRFVYALPEHLLFGRRGVHTRFWIKEGSQALASGRSWAIRRWGRVWS
jgi:hypothetical protein